MVTLNWQAQRSERPEWIDNVWVADIDMQGGLPKLRVTIERQGAQYAASAMGLGVDDPVHIGLGFHKSFVDAEQTIQIAIEAAFAMSIGLGRGY